MKTVLKIGGLLLAVPVAALAGLASVVAVRGVPAYAAPKPVVPALVATPERLAQGEKLVLANCVACHRNPATSALTGHRLSEMPAQFGRLYSANITRDPSHGIGRWTDAQLVGLLRTGIGPEGRYRIGMPSFVHMSDEDLASIVAFLRSDNALVQPHPDATPAQELSFLLKMLANTVMKPAALPAAPIAAPAAANAAAFGRYLVVGRYMCYDCHSKDFKTNNQTESEKSEGYLGGGNEMVNQQGQTVLSRNITGDPDTGIGDWSEAQFGRAVRFGMAPGGPVRDPMPKYSQLTDEEVHDLYTYLQSVPKIRHDVRRAGAAPRG